MNKKVWKRLNRCVMIAVLTAGLAPAGIGRPAVSAAAAPSGLMVEAAPPASAAPAAADDAAAAAPPSGAAAQAPAAQEPAAGPSGDPEAAPAEPAGPDAGGDSPAAGGSATDSSGAAGPERQAAPDSDPAADKAEAAEASALTQASAAPIVADTFESAAAGANPPGWTIGSPPAGVTAKVTASADRGGKVLTVSQAAPVANTYNFRRPAAVTSAKSSLSYSFSVPQTDTVIYLPTPGKDTAALAQFAVYGGSISYMGQGVSTWTKLMPVEPNVWYDVRVAMNSGTGTFDLEVDGRRLLTKKPMKNSGPMNSFSVAVYKEHSGSASFDDFYVNGYIAAVSASFAEPQVQVPPGRDIDLELVFDPADATDRSATFSSSDESVATVDANGRVHGVSEGTAVITAQPDEPIAAAQTTVTVADVPVSGVTVEAPAGPLPVGSHTLLDASFEPEGASETDLTWTSADESVATVDGYGEVTAVAPGQTTITAAAVSGAEGEAAVTVAARTVMRELFVSPQGSDGGSGAAASPFATIGRAQQEVRLLNDNMTGDIVVNLAAGTFALNAPLAFTPEDSGTNGYFVTYRGAGGEDTVVSGGRTIAGWTETAAGSGVYRSNVGTGLETRQLFVDGVRAVRARSEGGLTRPVKTATGYTSEDTAIASWSDAPELELVFEDEWTNSRVRVQSVTQANGLAQITLRQPGWTAVSNRSQTSATLPVYYENARELLDRPGEWYYDKAAGVMYYKPRAWEDLGTATVVAPVLETLATIMGESADNPVRNLNFEDIAFMYSTWMRPSTDAGHSDAQNNHLRYAGSPDQLPPAAIMAELSNGVNFTGSTFAKLGITGIRLQNGVQNSLIEGSRFYDISGGAVNVGQPISSDRDIFNPDDHRLIMKNDDIVNNVIHDIGVDFKSAAAVSAGYPLDMDISHNEMYELPYSGVHIGYGWAKAFDPVTRNVKVEDNLIYDLMGKGLRDGGAIYTMGATGATADDKNFVGGNYIRNQLEANAALYTDEGTAFWKFEHNVIDLKDTPPWSTSVRWAMAYVPSIHDVEYVHNYTTTATFTNNSDRVVFADNTVVPDANWPQEAQAIIANAGLQSAYAALNDGEIGRWSTAVLELESGQSGTLQLTSIGGKDESNSAAGASIYYRSLDPQIAQVNSQGVATGVSTGAATIEIAVIEGSVLRILHAQVQVDDETTDIGLEGRPGHVAYAKEGQTLDLEAYGVSRFGDRTALTSVGYDSGDDSVFTVNAAGKLTAVAEGAAALTITAAGPDGEALDVEYEVKVWKDGTVYTHSLQPEIENPSGWYVNTQANALSELAGGTLSLRAPSGYAVYKDRKFQNEMLNFNLKIDDVPGSGNWYALMLNNQDIEQNYSTGTMYMSVIGSGGIELHRFNAGKRTTIYGGTSQAPGLEGLSIPNTMLGFGAEHEIQTGVFKESGGVRVVLTSDGTEVFNYLDPSADAIGEAGHIGFISRQRITELSY
ncbi:Ig-like domain-containing protein [Saccharibacillus sp. CPCC 101409]|uniref:Ig-like domain-containing protein n=1 Tax=Saccharibacillus sp. CPCC 101409 TaxID=3058041 RepID=UPI002672A6FD|nr:Ig-like domain-containing protein [Saccharibacillus sp. CPCC 101409]MDO3412558.1 Ig-like domain-containing protein [Saccharibacillus sp. CPCC 101409]